MTDGMIRTIERHAAETAAQTGCPMINARILDAMRRVPRAHFVPAAERYAAGDDSPLPIGWGQTISQPFIVALMIELLGVDAGQRVLEVGSGCGYLAAVLAELGVTVYGIEIVPPLAARAAEVLAELGYTAAHIRCGDGWHGWPEAAPFDGIIVSAACPGIAPSLQAQLRAGGRIVMPLDDAAGWQSLQLLQREGNGEWTRRRVLDVRFVPLTRTSA